MVKKLFGSFRTNAFYMAGLAMLLNKAGINVGVDQLGTDIDTIALGVSGAIAGIGVIRDYVRKFKK